MTGEGPAPGDLHGAEVARALDRLGELASAWVHDRPGRVPLGRLGDPAALHAALGGLITDTGSGIDAAWRAFTDVVAPATLGLDSERFLAFLPMSPSVASVWMDAVVGATSFSAESWLEAAGAVAAETEVIELLAATAGLPPGAGGCFMSGGSIGNLSALAVARDTAGGRRTCAVADTAHASVAGALHLLGMDALVVPTGASARLTGSALREAIGARHDIAAVVASAGSTNAGVIDDLDGCAEVAGELGAWLHVDGAYGLAAMLLPELRARFAGIERADSFIVDPHKWLFATAGSCALVYRDPAAARAVHAQHGPYIETMHATGSDVFDPSDVGFQLTRRASGLPLWFALAVHGLDAHRDAIRHAIALARAFAGAMRASGVAAPVVEPELGVVLFRRDGWGREAWRAWAQRLLDDGTAFVAPTTFLGEPMGRVAFMHPLTPMTLVDELVATLR